MKKKTLALVLALVLVFGCAVGGTLAWLMDTTGEVTNTFTVGDIDIELKEYELDSENNRLLEGPSNEVTSEDEYKIVPGDTQPKDPFVRFTKASEPCWLFVKIEEKNNTVGTKKYVTYSVAGGWAELTGVDGVYYKKLESLTAADTSFSILADNQVSYSNQLTKADLNAVTDTTKPQLVFTAYAVQLEAADSASAAWTAATTSAN